MDAERCPICLDGFDDKADIHCLPCFGDKAFVGGKPCKALFHEACVTSLMTNSSELTCPVCRASLPDESSDLLRNVISKLFTGEYEKEVSEKAKREIESMNATMTHLKARIRMLTFEKTFIVHQHEVNLSNLLTQKQNIEARLDLLINARNDAVQCQLRTARDLELKNNDFKDMEQEVKRTNEEKFHLQKELQWARERIAELVSETSALKYECEHQWGTVIKTPDGKRTRVL
jgi:DNA repair exonuclease SbcCD ATPase subunit